MPLPWTRSIPPVAIAVGVLLSACEPRQPDRESAAATITDTVAGTWEERTGTIPVTSGSEEARRLYLEGRALSEQLRLHDGRALYQQAAAADPSFAMAHYQLAVNAATARDFFSHLKQAVALEDQVSEGERLMIRAAEAGGNANPARAFQLQQELVARYPGDERAHFLLGGTYFGRQEYDKAIEHYRTATELNPGFSPAYNLLGYAYRQVERYDDAEAAFRKYIDLVPGDPNPYDSYAELLMKLGRFDESRAQYRKALEVNRHFTPSRVGIANNLMLQGRPDSATAEMDALYDAARDDGDRRTALFVKGVVLVDARRPDAAIREIEREYALDAGLADTANMSADAFMIGNILLDAGRTTEAAARFRQSLDLIERSSLSDDVKQDARLGDHLNRGSVALAAGEIATARAEAAAYAEGARSRRNQVRLQQAHQLEGAIALKERHYDAAIEHLAQANRQDPQVLYLTALAWQGKGDAAKAKDFAGRAAHANVLPLLTYAFVRGKAAKLAG